MDSQGLGSELINMGSLEDADSSSKLNKFRYNVTSLELKAMIIETIGVIALVITNCY